MGVRRRHIFLFQGQQLVETFALPSEVHAADVDDSGLVVVGAGRGRGS